MLREVGRGRTLQPEERHAARDASLHVVLNPAISRLGGISACLRAPRLLRRCGPTKANLLNQSKGASMAADVNRPVATTSVFGPLAPAMEFAIDAAQRSLLFWDVMRQRGDQYLEHLEQSAPH